MTDQVREILENLKCGDRVSVTYGLGRSLQMISGVVKKIDECITIEKDNGKPGAVDLELLRAIDVQDGDADAGEAADVEQTAAAPMPVVRPSAPPIREEAFIARKFVDLPPAHAYTPAVEEKLKNMARQMREEKGLTIGGGLVAILNSLQDAIKNKSIAYKYHDIRRKILELWDKCKSESDFRNFYYVLGLSAICAGEYGQALEPLVRAEKYATAAYAASCDKNTEMQEIFHMCSLIAGDEDIAIDQYIVETCLKRRDIWPLVYLLRTKGGDNGFCEQAASCLYRIFQKSGFHATVSITPYDDAYVAAKILVEVFPEGWYGETPTMKSWNTYHSYQYPIKASELKPGKPTILTRKIISFDTKKLYGFVDGEPNYYFHIKQVDNRDERGVLLRALLAEGLGEDLEVSFRKSVSPSPNGEFAATDVCLTESGYKAARRIVEGDGIRRNGGFIAEYNRIEEYGFIQTGRVRHRFTLEAVRDPYLKAYYKENISPKEQDVSFELAGDGRKKSVADICWVNPDRQDYEESAEHVTEEEKRQWQAFLGGRENRKQIAVDKDPYAHLPFNSLPDWRPRRSFDPRPLTWTVNEAPLKEEDKPSSQAKPASLPAAGKKDWEAVLQQGRKAVQRGDLEEAERKMLYALENSGNGEMIIGDLISLYLRQPDKLQRAVDLLDKYEGRVSIEKMLNLKIQVNDKLKNHTVLCGLYEQAVQHAKSTSQKSHNLFRLVGVYMDLGKYEEALEVCRRWDSLYQQNRFTTEGVKLQKVMGNIERKKAVCYYHIGRREDACRIATDLVRINPSDEAANAILKGTLIADSFTGEEYAGYDEDALLENLSEDKQSRLSRFARSLIQGCDIGVVLKSKDIKEGKYTGDAKRAKEDVELLVNRRRGTTTKARSENLFAAYKIMEQVEQREGRQVWRPYYRYLLAGRGMASWGDYMVTQSSRQLDTTRMAYLFSLKVLAPRNGLEQDWINSYNRYLKSYFLGKNELESYISQQTNSQEKDGANADVFASNYLPDVLVGEFVAGILELLRTLKDQGEWQHTLMEDLYNKNEKLRMAVAKQLGELLSEEAGEVTFEGFADKLKNAVYFMETRHGMLHEVLEGIRGNFLEEMIPRWQLAELEPDSWHGLLNALDMSRIGRIYQVMRRSQDYFVNVDFESREDCLRVSLTEFREIIQDIQAEPTDICYDEFLPFLEALNGKLVEAQNRLYQEFRPELTWQQSVSPFYTPDRMVQIQLLVKNAVNYQAAELLHIESVAGPDVTYFRECEASFNLRGGEEREFIFALQISEEAQRVGSFSIELCYAYKFSDTSQSVAKEEKTEGFTFVIRDEGADPLYNPFKDHIGKRMTDANMFYGRSGLIEQIAEMICLPNSERMNYGRAISLYGQTRTGKSSLLYHLKERLGEKYGERILIWDMANIGEIKGGGDSGDYLANFLYTMLDVGGEAFYDNEKLAACARARGLEAPVGQIMEKPSLAMNYFTSYMRKLNHILEENNCIIVLFIDEFTYLHGQIKEGKLSEDFMKFWKAFLQNYCVFAIVAGQDDMPEFMREYQNEFACMELRKITYLDEVSAKRLIREPLERENNQNHIFRDDGSVDMLYKLTSGSAFLTIILCSNLVEYLNDKGARMVTRGIVDDFLRNRALGANSFLAEAHFEAQLQERGHREFDQVNKDILLSIARQSQATGHANIGKITCGDMSRDDLESLLQRLVDRNVLVKQGRDEYKIQVELLEKWLINTMGE